MPEQSNDYRVVVFGAGGVGKSSLVLRFVKGTFRDTYIPTVEDTYRQVRHNPIVQTKQLTVIKHTSADGTSCLTFNGTFISLGDQLRQERLHAADH